jgi:hypothetical protein
VPSLFRAQRLGARQQHAAGAHEHLQQTGDGSDVTACDLNPLVWSGNQPQKTPAANLHGTVPPPNITSSTAEEAAYYREATRTFASAVAAFQALFAQQAASIDTVLFSADGDFIHDFFDCMYLGPYSRVDVLACDPENSLECPFYARDNMSGASRAFTACFGDIMHGDHMLPFTCGSQARRSIIKYFFRNFSKVAEGGKGLSMNVSRKIKASTEALIQNYSDPRSWGCWDPVLRKCHIRACAWANGYAPCLNSDYTISSEQVSDLIVETILAVLPDYYEKTMQDSAPWTAYYDDGNGPPAQWSTEAGSAAVAQQLGLFAPHSPVVSYSAEEVYSMPLHTDALSSRTLRGPTWGLCTSLLAQTAMSVPLLFSQLAGDWLPAGFNPGSDMADLQQVEWVVQNMTQHLAMENCPFAWHKSRRHAPSRSAVCARQRQQWPAAGASRLNVGTVSIQSAAGEIQARVGEGLSFPFHGFMQGQIGHADQTCACATSDPVITGQCVVSQESCVSFLNFSGAQTADPACSVLAGACTLSGGRYPRTSVPAVLQCLRSVYSDSEGGVRCPELGPSDWWGLFPVDCTDSECDMAQQWTSVASNNIPYDATRFLNEGRAGLRLPNFKHVNSTYHRSIHYGRGGNPIDMMQPQCFEATDLLGTDNLADTVLRKLFPAAQALFDSPPTAACTRFVIEVVRAEAMSLVSDSAGAKARVQATRWKRRCAARIRQLGMCKMQGVFYDVAPPANWPELVDCGGITLVGLQGAYLTPGCVVVDQQQRQMFDAHMCLAQQRDAVVSSSNAVINSRQQQLTSKCALSPQPLDLVQGSVPLSMVHSAGQPLAPVEALTELTDSMNFEYVRTVSSSDKAAREHVSHVLDWWPDDLMAMPPGYHPTAATDPSELAPALFDSHYAYDAATQKAFYVHNALRNGSLLYTTAGASGLCRSHSVAMPMFDTNTNRICTRVAKKAATDTPTMPVATPVGPGSTEEVGPTFTDAYIAKNFEPEHCADSHSDVPWNADPDDFQSRSAGGILGWQHYASMDAAGVTSYDTLTEKAFPPAWYELSSLQPYDDELWSAACRAKTWGAGIACKSSGECPGDANNMVCLPLGASSSSDSVCFSNMAHLESAATGVTIRQPCFRTDHCADGLVCLVDGGCAPLYMHAWNANEWPMEATILADQCGFFDKVHTYTQSTRGASPWETVPDLLQAHGMCSHHNWFSYRHAAKDGACPRKSSLDNSYAYLSCNASTAAWPWVQQRFDGKSTSSSSAAAERQSMAAGNMLLAQPHPCDVAYMHLQAPQSKKRMQVCSGFEGQEADPLSTTSTYLHYALPAEHKTWAGVTMRSSDLTDTSQWLRTYEESSGEVHVGLLQLEKSTDVPLGFLGADEKAEGVLGDMSVPKNVEFFRCADRLACNNPPYTYNGVDVSHRLVPMSVSGTKTTHRNISETSLRKC